MLRRALREPNAIVFAAQVAALLLYPFMESRDVGRALFSIFGIAILGLVVRAVRESPALTWVGVLFAIPATALLLIQAVTRSDSLFPYSAAFEAPSTKQGQALVEAWGQRTPLVIVATEGEVNLVKSFRNLQRVVVLEPSELEVGAVVWARSLLVTETALPLVEGRAQ